MNEDIILDILAENPTSVKDWEEAIKIWNKDNDEINYVISLSDSMPIGWIGINGLLSDEKIIWIKVIAILPKYWGQGYGSLSIGILKEYFSSNGYNEIRLWTDKNNERAKQCYKKNEFNIVKEEIRKVGARQKVRKRLLFSSLL